MVSTFNLIRNAMAALSIFAVAQISADVCCGASASAGSVFVRGDLLYLQAQEDGLSNCGPALVLDDINVDGYPITRVCSNCKSQGDSWDFGYRVAAGIRLSGCEPSPWEISGLYTHFARGSSLKCVDRNDSKWRLKFDYADLLMSYYLSSCDSLNVKFFGGLRAAVIDQHLHNFFISNHDDFIHVPPIRECIVNDQVFKDKFRGLGPLAGFEAGYDFGCGLNIFFNADAGCLFGQHRTRKNWSTYTQVDTYKAENSCKLNNCQYFVDSAIGLRWNILLCGNTELSLQVGVEQHTYFNVNFLSDRGNLNLYGGSFSAGLRF